jgi:NAD(P)-dependent dehydrogenase (short-subunit alcohol dehydrogenase family)
MEYMLAGKTVLIAGGSSGVELAPLRVNAVSPGFVEEKPKAVQEYARQFPSQRLASVTDVAMAYLYLMTNPYATGTITVVDGGARLG